MLVTLETSQVCTLSPAQAVAHLHLPATPELRPHLTPELRLLPALETTARICLLLFNAELPQKTPLKSTLNLSSTPEAGCVTLILNIVAILLAEVSTAPVIL